MYHVPNPHCIRIWRIKVLYHLPLNLELDSCLSCGCHPDLPMQHKQLQSSMALTEENLHSTATARRFWYQPLHADVHEATNLGESQGWDLTWIRIISCSEFTAQASRPNVLLCTLLIKICDFPHENLQNFCLHIHFIVITVVLVMPVNRNIEKEIKRANGRGVRSCFITNQF